MIDMIAPHGENTSINLKTTILKILIYLEFIDFGFIYIFLTLKLNISPFWVKLAADHWTYVAATQVITSIISP
jgi:hypothetical protein